MNINNPRDGYYYAACRIARKMNTLTGAIISKEQIKLLSQLMEEEMSSPLTQLRNERDMAIRQKDEMFYKALMIMGESAASQLI